MRKEKVKITESQLRNIIRNVIKESIDEISLYHGTNADFNKFDTAYMSSGWGKQAYGYGFYLTTSYDAAKDYAYDSNKGQVMQVEVPDGKYLTDKSISMREKERITRIFFKYITKENPGTIDSYPDEQTRQDFWNYEVSYILNCSTGTYVYGTIASLMGSDEDTSNFLHDKCGYVGMKIQDVYSNEKYPPITYVIFNPNDIKILNKNVVMEGKKTSNPAIQEFNRAFTFGKYIGQDKVKVIQEDPEYCVWLCSKMKYPPFTDKQMGLLDVAYYKKHKIFPLKSVKTPNYAQIRGVLVKDMTAEQLQYVYEHGSDEFKWLVKQEHDNRGWHRTHDGGAPAFQSDDVGDTAWMNRR